MSDTLCWFHLHIIVISLINWSRCFLLKRDSSTVNGYHALGAYSESDYIVVFFFNDLVLLTPYPSSLLCSPHVVSNFVTVFLTCFFQDA